MRNLMMAAVLALAGIGQVRGEADAARGVCAEAAWCGWNSVKVNGVTVACSQYNCRKHGRIEHSESH